jgi:biotin synthase
MIADAGFEVEGAGEVTLPAHRATVPAGGCGSHEGAGCGSHEGAGCGAHESAGVCGSGSASASSSTSAPAPQADEVRRDLVAVRRRGAGTDLAPNA